MDSTSPSLPARILVVDDAAFVRSAVGSLLQNRAEWQVIGEAPDGLEAVKRATELTPDLMLLDIGLPGLDGLEVAKRVHVAVPGTKILFLSMNSNAVVVRAALSNGANGYVLKIDAGRELVPAIDAVIRGRKFVSSGIAGRENSECD
jgi:two-component system NarL family response regulator